MGKKGHKTKSGEEDHHDTVPQEEAIAEQPETHEKIIEESHPEEVHEVQHDAQPVENVQHIEEAPNEVPETHIADESQLVEGGEAQQIDEEKKSSVAEDRKQSGASTDVAEKEDATVPAAASAEIVIETPHPEPEHHDKKKKGGKHKKGKGDTASKSEDEDVEVKQVDSTAVETKPKEDETEEDTTDAKHSKKKGKKGKKHAVDTDSEESKPSLKKHKKEKPHHDEESQDSESIKKKHKKGKGKVKMKDIKHEASTDTGSPQSELQEIGRKTPETETRGSVRLSADEPMVLGETRKSRVQILEEIRSKIELRMSMVAALRSSSVLEKSPSRTRSSQADLKKRRRSKEMRSKLTLGSATSDESSDEYSVESFEESKDDKKRKKKDKGHKKKTQEPSAVLIRTEKDETAEKIPSKEEILEVKASKEKVKKAKKGKKKKEKKEKKDEKDDKPKELDPISEIKRIIALAKELNTPIPPILEEVVKGPKKKGKKEKGRPTAEMIEKARIEAEAQAKKLEEIMKKKREGERLAAIEKEKRESQEQIWRMEQLQKSCHFINELIEHHNEITAQTKEELEWQKYVACGRLPNPSMCDQMNTYLHLWEMAMDTTTIKDASNRTKDIINLLEELDELIDTAEGPDVDKIENWKWVRKLFREHQRDSLNVTTYILLRNVEHNLHRINIPTADYNYKDQFLTMCIWLRVQLPIPLPNPRRPPKPRIDIKMDLLNMDILFPLAIDGENAAVRGMYLNYDHLSDTSTSYNMPKAPDEFNLNILEYMNKEYRTKLKYKYDKRDKVDKKVERVARSSNSSAQTETAVAQYTNIDEQSDKPAHIEVIEEKDDFSSDEEIPLVPYKQLKPSASEYANSLEDDLYNNNRKNLTLDLEDHVLNLRKFKILGGVFHIDLLAQPPQPQDFITMDMTITSLYLPKRLESVPFHVSYIPPAASTDSSVRKLPEEIEEEMKRQEEEMDKLMLVTLKWPQHVIFLELPIVVYWDEEDLFWTKREIHDVKHNEEKSTLTFRTGIFGVFGLATYKYVNLPFQAYDLKPEADESVTLQLTAAILMVEFNVKDGKIALSQLQNSPNNALQDIVGQYFDLHKLKRMMQDAGIDIFPDFDAFCYVDGSCEKHWSTEKHLYYNMAQMANCFNFSWSRWNIQAGRRKMVLQMREYNAAKTKQKNHQMLLVTPVKATFVECTEVSQVFSEQEMETKKFASDLYHLMKFTSGIHIRNNVMQASKENVYALSQLLIATRVLSFS